MDRDMQVIKKIHSECEFIVNALKDISHEEFLNNETLKRAMSMSLLNIGELAKKLSDNFHSKHKNIPLKEIKGMRDHVAHGYFHLSFEIIWTTINKRIPELLAQTTKIIT